MATLADHPEGRADLQAVGRDSIPGEADGADETVPDEQHDAPEDHERYHGGHELRKGPLHRDRRLLPHRSL